MVSPLFAPAGRRVNSFRGGIRTTKRFSGGFGPAFAGNIDCVLGREKSRQKEPGP